MSLHKYKEILSDRGSPLPPGCPQRYRTVYKDRDAHTVFPGEMRKAVDDGASTIQQVLITDHWLLVHFAIVLLCLPCVPVSEGYRFII